MGGVKCTPFPNKFVDPEIAMESEMPDALKLNGAQT